MTDTILDRTADSSNPAWTTPLEAGSQRRDALAA